MQSRCLITEASFHTLVGETVELAGMAFHATPLTSPSPSAIALNGFAMLAVCIALPALFIEPSIEPVALEASGSSLGDGPM